MPKRMSQRTSPLFAEAGGALTALCPYALAALLCLAFLFPGVWGCKSGGKKDGVAPASSLKVMRVPIDEEPRSIEPGMSIMLQDYLIALNLHVGLFRYDSKSTLNPYLVRDWSLSPDRLTYTFLLHDNFKWHNGQPVTAADFKAGWERHLDPKLNAWGANYLSDIAGAREMLDGKATTLAGVEAVDAHTLKVKLIHPDPRFIAQLGTTPTWVAPADSTVKGEARWKKAPEGGGPFRFVEWQTRSRLVLEANNDASPRPFLDRIEFLIVPDPATALNMYRNGQLDIVPVTAGELPGILRDPVLSHEIHSWPAAQLIVVGLNGKKIPAFKDLRIRKAFMHAIDRQAICHQVLFDSWTPAAEFIPEGMPGHEGGKTIAYDPELARKLMAEAGFPNGRGFPATTLATVGATEATAAAAIAAQLDRNLGIKVDVQRYEPSDMYQGLLSRRWDLFLGGRNADYMSPEQLLFRLLHSHTAENYIDYVNPKLDAVIDRALSAANPKEEMALWQEANQIAIDDAALIPIAYGKFIYLVKPGVAGFSSNLLGPLGFDTVRKNNSDR